MRKLAQYNMSRLIDYLTERLAFERSSVRLHDAILDRMNRISDPQMQTTLLQMRLNRDDEKEHEEWLEAQIRDLGGDAHEKTEHAQLIEREAQGIEEIAQGDRQLSHLFHALLMAELVDNAGWQLLLELADEAGDDEARSAFRKRLHEEEHHLVFARQLAVTVAREEVLGRQRMEELAP